MKAIVINDADDTRCDYEFVNNFLVRHKDGTELLEVYQLSFKQGKLEEGSSIGEFNKVKTIKIDEFTKESSFVSMQPASRQS